MKGKVKEAFLVMQMTTMAGYGTAYLVMKLEKGNRKILVMSLLKDHALGNFG